VTKNDVGQVGRRSNQNIAIPIAVEISSAAHGQAQLLVRTGSGDTVALVAGKGCKVDVGEGCGVAVAEQHVRGSTIHRAGSIVQVCSDDDVTVSVAVDVAGTADAVAAHIPGCGADDLETGAGGGDMC
jgi:hypothetical protein